MANNRETATARGLQAPFVATDAAPLHRGIVVTPHAAIEKYAPLKAEPHAIYTRVLEQYTVFLRRLEALGVALDRIPEGTAALGCAAADLAVVTAKGAILMRPSDLTRAQDLAAVEALLASNGIPIIGRIEAPGLLDGADVLVSEDRIFVGVPHGSGRHARRGNDIGRRQFASLIDLPVVEVAVNAEFGRLRAVASVVDANTVLLGGDAVDAAGFDGFEIIRLPLGEEYAAGVLTLAPRFILANLRFQEAPKIFRKAKLKVESFDLWELGKLGLSPSCLILALSRK